MTMCWMPNLSKRLAPGDASQIVTGPDDEVVHQLIQQDQHRLSCKALQVAMRQAEAWFIGFELGLHAAATRHAPRAS